LKAVRSSLTTHISMGFIAIFVGSLSSCLYEEKLPPPITTGSALALPAVGGTVPVYVFITGDALLSVRRETVSGITASGAGFHALSADEAADGAGGAEKLLAKLSDETEIAHVAKSSGAVLGALNPAPVGPAADDPLLGAAAGALAVAVALMGSIGVGTYLGANAHARRVDMLEDISLPDGTDDCPLHGYVFLPAGDYR
jgi:hypothetical protein